ncbi:hypothetical protein KBZ10_25385 [Streptomyces sp. F63]|uniref:hypothetical protein n=1 Tax=Streptomyces sp. F63 TaxID=2824887 RepID=UPI001B37B0CB|nr:hypothetical protein [Streptomyces sp. F63]MBQ0987790.1 hypothetical protein [Streptomyces sp. F63]
MDTPPKRPEGATRIERRRADALMMITGLLASSVLLSWLGFADASGALSYLGRLTGFFMLIAAVLALVGAVAVIDYWGKERVANSGAVVLLGVLAVLLANLMILAIHAQGHEYTPYLVIWTVLTLWSVWALWTLCHRKQVWESIRSRPTFAVGVLVTGIIAVANFSYSQIYVPYSNPVLVSSTVKFGEPVANQNGGTLLPLRLRIKNTGKVAVYAIQSLYTVTGQKASHVKQERGPEGWKEEIDNLSNEIHQNVDIEGYYTIESGRFTEPGLWLEPGESLTEEKIVELPEALPYQAVTATTYVNLARKDRLTLDSPSPKHSWKSSAQPAPSWVTGWGSGGDGVDYVQHTYTVQPSSILFEVTRIPKVITTWWVLDPSGPYLATTISSPGEEDDPPTQKEVDSWVKRYGFIRTTSGTAELPVSGFPGQ